MTVTQLPPTRFVVAYPCPSWCGPACEKWWENEVDGHLTEYGVHNSPAGHIEGGTDGDGLNGVNAWVYRIDLDDDRGQPYIGIQVDGSDCVDQGFLTPARARQFAAELMNLADKAEGVER